MLIKFSVLTNFVNRRVRLNMPRVRCNVLRKRSRTEWYFLVALLTFIGICTVVYFAYVAPWIAGDINIRMGADSDRYWDSVKDLRLGEGGPLFTATTNFLGPVAIGLLLRNGVGVMVFNILLFLLAMKVASSIPDVDVSVFGFLLFLNFELIPSLTTLNKEIFALFSSVLIAKYLYAKKPSALALLGVLLVALFARWEEAAILIFYLILRFVFRYRRKTALISLIALVTVAFPVGLRVLGLDLSTFDWLMQGANTIIVLNKIEYAYGFPFVVIPKIVMTVAGSWVSYSFYTANPGIVGGFTDPQQEIFQPLGCVALTVVFAYAFWTKRMKLSSPIAMFVVITLIVTAATPFIQPRYLYGAYVMLCIELARPKHLYGVTESTLTRAQRFVVGGKKV
jgi:hypothetical protein